MIVGFGEVPLTAAAEILKRSLRIHVVGAEKAINFLDFFREVDFISLLELVFVVRPHMLPAAGLEAAAVPTVDGRPPVVAGGAICGGQLDWVLGPGLRVQVVGGTYGNSIDPNFDCGSGAPDMIMCFNTGLYAYPNWSVSSDT